MISLIKLILENKETVNLTFHTYSCDILIKCNKDYNKKEILERVRGITNVTIVKVSDKGFDRKDDKYEYSRLFIKFNTNLNPEEELSIIMEKMMHSDTSRGYFNIIGLVSAKPILDTLKQE